MTLKENLYKFCEQNELKELTCIIHVSLLNYLSSISKTHTEWVNFSPKTLDYFTGIGENVAHKLLIFLSNHTKNIIVEYRLNCKNDINEYGYTSIEKDINENIIIVDCCDNCDEEHHYNIEEKEYFIIGFSAKRNELLQELQLTNKNIIKDLIVMNTSDNNIEGLAKIIVSKLDIKKIEDKEEAKKGFIGYLKTFREFTNVISDISGDAASVSGNVLKIVEDATGLSSIKGFISEDKTSSGS